MICDEKYVVNHFKETKELLEAISSKDIAHWILNQGYFAEHYILPLSFQVSNFILQTKVYKKQLNKLKRKDLINISHHKTILSSRIFSIQHPHNYHDIVFHLEKNWDNIISHLFSEENKIYSYSFPIALTKKHSKAELSNLRTGRMIYEWLSMAEKDLSLIHI